MVIYEDQTAALRTSSFLGRVVKRTGIGLTMKLWMASLLYSPSLREQAAVEAAKADIIILSLNGKRDLTAIVQDWLTRWLNHKGNQPSAFGIFLNPETQRLEPDETMITLIRTIVIAGGAEFFCNTPEPTSFGSRKDFRGSW